MAKITYSVQQGTSAGNQSLEDIPWFVVKSVDREDGSLLPRLYQIHTPEGMDEEIAGLEAAGENTDNARAARADLAWRLKAQEERRQRKN